jgi:hypothetical protein
MNSGFVLGTVSAHTISLPAAYTYNSSGNANSATWTSVGNYNVVFPGLATALFYGGPIVGGDVQVTAVGTSARCKVNNWVANGTTGVVGVNVRCYSLSGSPVDSSFRASFVGRASASSLQEGAYVYASQASGSVYTASGPYVWNSSLGDVYVTPHSYGTAGTYTIQFVGQIGGYDFSTNPDPCSGLPTYNGGTLQVTAYGNGNAYCKPGNFYRDSNDTYVDVFCFDGSSGSPTDSMFDLVYDTLSPNAIPNSAFTYANNPTASSYNPPDGFTAIIVPRHDDNLCPYYVLPPPTSYLATIFRNSLGKYSVFFPGISLGTTSLFHTTAYGMGPETCGNAGASNSTYQSVAGVMLNVNCVSFAGASVDTQFIVTYSADGVIAVR